MKHISEASDEWVKSLHRTSPHAPARICPPCDGNCNQGRDCSAEWKPASGWIVLVVFAMSGLAMAAVFALGFLAGRVWP